MTGKFVDIPFLHLRTTAKEKTPQYLSRIVALRARRLALLQAVPPNQV